MAMELKLHQDDGRSQGAARAAVGATDDMPLAALFGRRPHSAKRPLSLRLNHLRTVSLSPLGLPLPLLVLAGSVASTPALARGDKFMWEQIVTEQLASHDGSLRKQGSLLDAQDARLAKYEDRLAALESQLKEQQVRLDEQKAQLTAQEASLVKLKVAEPEPVGLQTAISTRLQSLEERYAALVSVGSSPYSILVRLLHLGKVVAHAIDPRPRIWQRSSENLQLHNAALSAGPSEEDKRCQGCLGRALRTDCPPGAVPMRTSTSPSYLICVRVEPDDLDATVSVFGRWEDAEFLRDVLMLLVQKVPLDEPFLVVDVGANIGAVTLFLASVLREVGFQRARVVAVEPEPENAAMLRASAALNGFGEAVDVVEAAAGNVSGPLVVHKFRSISAGSLVLPMDFPNDPRVARGWVGATADLPYESFDVLGVRLEELLASERRIDLLKVDVESAELEVLLGLGPALLRIVGAIVFEFRVWAPRLSGLSEEGKESRSAKELLHLLSEAGMTLWCVAACETELAQVLDPQETRPAFLGSEVEPASFEAFIALSERLWTVRRDFDVVAISPARAGVPVGR
eukprot:TRINITY_DN42643_c0_g1_i1.p1 TRINITY_DN42643_c0_g1~~TRINITY_DN42643_c0_g1_i1.p1  ORF type:complete len:598 (+),score=95.22 TRINITY_DN42643_c0_g1_i1:80-1795(+)